MLLKNQEEIEAFLKETGLVDPENPEFNAQFGAHSTGKQGQEFGRIKAGVFEGGLYVKNRGHKVANANEYVSEGILSTSVYLNDEESNEVDTSLPFISTGANPLVDEKGNIIGSIVYAFPQRLDGIFLGKIHPGDDNRKTASSCIFDMLGIETIPPEFILGVSYGKSTDKGVNVLEVNPRFFALSKENKEHAKEQVLELFENNPKLKEICVSEGLTPDEQARSFYEKNERLISVIKKYGQIFQDMIESLDMPSETTTLDSKKDSVSMGR